MATQVASLVAKIDADTRGLEKGLNKTKGLLSGTAGAAAGLATALGVGVVGGAAAAATGIVALGAKGIKSAIELEQQVANIRSVFSGVAPEVENVNDLILGLGVDPGLKVSADEAAKSIELLARNGLSWQEISEGAARNSILLANATGADFGTAADVATDVMALFNIEAADMAKAVDGITSVVTNSKFDINDFALALGQGGGVAANVGVTLEDFTTTLAGIASGFKSGSEAGTAYRAFLNRLIPSTEPAADAMRKLGLFSGLTETEFEKLSVKIEKTKNKIAALNPESKNYQERLTELKGELRAMEGQLVKGNNAFFDSQGNMKSMAEVSEILLNATKDLTAEQKINTFQTIFQTDASMAAFEILKQGEVVYTDAAKAAKELGVKQEDLAHIIEGGITKFEILQLTMGDTSAAEAVGIRVDTLAGLLGFLSDQIDANVTKIGFALKPAFQALAEAAYELSGIVMPALVTMFEHLGKFLESTIPVAIDFTKDAINNTLIPGLDSLKKWWDTNKGPIITAVDATLGAIKTTANTLAATVIPAVVTAFGTVSKWWTDNKGDIEGGVDDTLGFIESISNDLKDDIIPKLVLIFGEIKDWWAGSDGQSLRTSAENVIGAIVSGLKVLFEPDGGVIGTLIGWLGNILDWFIDNKEPISQAVGAIVDIIEGIAIVFETIGNNIDDIWKSVIKPAIEAIGTAFGGLVRILAAYAEGDFAGAMDIMGETFGALFNPTDGKMVEFLTGFVTVTKNILGGMLQAVLKILGADQDAQALVEAWEGVWENAKTVMEAVWGDIQDSISGFFTDIASDMESAGADIIEGLKKGLEDNKNKVFTWLGDFLSEFKTSFLKFFGIGSPSKLMMDIAADVMAGFTIGLENNASGALAAMDEFVRSFVGTASKIGRAFVNEQSSIADEMEDEVERLTDLWNMSSQVDLSEVSLSELREAFSAWDRAGILTPRKRQILQDLISAREELHNATVRQLNTEAALEDLSRKQNQLDFLQQQKDLIAQAVGAGINLEDLMVNRLGKMVQFGAGANPAEIFNLSAALLDEIISQQNTEFDNVQALIQAEKEKLEIQEQQAAVQAEQARIAEKQAALKAEQDKLKFIKDQINLIEEIDEMGLDKASILQGFTLGTEADMGEFLEVMTRFTQAVIQQTKEQFEIASPSKVFKRMGQQLIQGLVVGANQEVGVFSNLLTNLLTLPMPAMMQQSGQASQVTNYNLSVNTGRNSQGVISDFTMMQAVARG